MKKQRTAIIVRQCPEAPKGHGCYEKKSVRPFIHGHFEAVLFEFLKTFDCAAKSFDALIRRTKGSSSRPLPATAARIVRSSIRSKTLPACRATYARVLARALSSKTFDLNLCRFGRSVRKSPVSPGLHSSLSTRPARDESKRIAMRLPSSPLKGEAGARRQRGNLWKCS